MYSSFRTFCDEADSPHTNHNVIFQTLHFFVKLNTAPLWCAEKHLVLQLYFFFRERLHIKELKDSLLFWMQPCLQLSNNPSLASLLKRGQTTSIIACDNDHLIGLYILFSVTIYLWKVYQRLSFGAASVSRIFRCRHVMVQHFPYLSGHFLGVPFCFS